MINIKTTKQLFDEIKASIEAALNVTIPLIGPAFLLAFSAVQAAKLRIYYLAISFLQKNTFVDTADPESMGGTLERWGRAVLGRSPFAALPAKYDVEITGDIGFTIPASTTFKSNDDSLNRGKLFILDVAVTLTTTPETITIRALEGGTDSALDIGDFLTATSPLALANDVVSVLAENEAPTDAEDIEDYREKALESFRLEPQGGAGVDYRLWSFDAAGVANVYPYAKTGFPSYLTIYVESEISASIDGKGTPSAAMLTDVRDVIEFNPDTTLPLNERGRRPLTDNPEVVSIVPLDVEVTIASSSFTPAEETLVASGIETYIQGIRPVVDSIPEPINDTIRLNSIIFAIESAVSGVNYGTVSFTVDGTPYASQYQMQESEIPFIDNSLVIFV
tara:strand:+ start:1012 stop:2187 length:1176 start_codon:yes stop_codon:yes gene_type:complete